MAGTYCPINIPGTQGIPGTNGATGANGISAVTFLTAPTIMPAELASVTVSVVSTAGFCVGEPVWLQFAGIMLVTAILNPTQMTLENVKFTPTGSYMINVAPGTAIPNSAMIGPTGIQGPAGVSPAAGMSANEPYVLLVAASVATPSAQILHGLGSGLMEFNDTTDTIAVQAEPLPITKGGTGAITAPLARAALSAAPNDAKYITQVANAELTGEQALSALATGYVKVTTGTGVLSSQAVPIPIADGGTGGINAAAARAALGAAALGANSDITSLSGLTSPLGLSCGGTGTAEGFAEAMYRDEKVSGTAGGAFNNGAWQIRDLNTESYDPSAIGSVLANQITLASAGTYIVEAEAPAYKVDNHQCRLQNMTAGTTVVFGTTARSAAAGDDITISRIHYRFTIAGLAVFQLQHQCTTTRAADGYGVASGYGNVEVYSWIKFTKVK